MGDGGAIATLPTRDHIVARNQRRHIGAVVHLTHGSGECHVGCRHRHICRSNGQRSIAKRNSVVATGQATGGDHVATAYIDGPNGRAAKGQRATQNSSAFAIHKAAVSYIGGSGVGSGEGRGIVRLADIVGFNQQIGSRDHTVRGAEGVRRQGVIGRV